MPAPSAYKGIIPALQVPFRADHSIDEKQLAKFAVWLSGIDGIVALMVNGHTGEVFSLTAAERAEVTRIAADAVKGRMPVISSVVCEGIKDAQAAARQLRDAGATALNIMPPHNWLRFGAKAAHVLDYFDAIADAAGIDMTVHVYPAWTKASYSPELLGKLAERPLIKAFKVGTRELGQYARDIRAIRTAAPEKAVLTCHDEYILASMVQGVDGALVGFASLIPKLICDLWRAVQAGDLKRAMALQFEIDPIKEIVYGAGEPTGDAHARMKLAMVYAGILPNAIVRPPTVEPTKDEAVRIHAIVKAAGLLRSNAT